MGIELRELTPEVVANLREHVVLPPEQAEWVGGTIDDVLQEAADHPEGKPWPRAVYSDGAPVGFIMLSWDVEPQPPEIIGPWFLWKLMVAPSAQGIGVGRAAVQRAAAIVREQGASELLTSCALGENSPYEFYVGLGFVPTGQFADNDEEVLALPV
jgi:diamine N-acetyltransferase